jgi:NAD-dependent SIR2 family protein deacetylase
MPNPNGLSIDQRLQFLLQSTESLHATAHEVTAQIMQQSEQLKAVTQNIDKLAGNIDKLALIAGAHRERFDDHEDRLKDLEG